MDLPDPTEPTDPAAPTGPALEGVPPAKAVGSLLAPVVACLRGDEEGFHVLVEDALEDGTVVDLVRAAPAMTRVYLRLAPPPGGAQAIIDSYSHAASEQFRDDEVVTLGAECLHVARAAERVPDSLAEMAKAVFVSDALERGQRPAVEGAVASVWWSAYLSARLRGADPIEEAAAICRWAARSA